MTNIYNKIIKKLNTYLKMDKKLIRLTESDLHKIINESVKKVIKESVYDEAEQKADKIANFIGYDEAFRILANLVCMDDPRKLLEYTSKMEKMYYADGIV